MKANTLEVVWHKKEAIHAFDTLATDNPEEIRVASGGVDCMVRIWLIRFGKELRSCVEHRATLNRHERGIGAVRFAPRKQGMQDLLATAADDSYIIIWKYVPGVTPLAGGLDEDEESTELWSTQKSLRGHIEDVSDLSWSHDRSKLASCGIDHSVFIWDVESGKKLAQIQTHTHYIQGISFDPFGTIVTSLSADRTLRVYTETKKSKKAKTTEWKQKHKIHAIQPEGYERPVRLWWDDTLPGFVRRLSWSPDGLFLAAPSAELNPPNSRMKVDVDVTKDTVDLTSENEDVKENMNPQSSVIQKRECVALFSRGTLQTPLALLPCPEPSVVTRWCPILFKLDPNLPNEITSLRYKMVLAVATSESGIGSVILYETQQMGAIFQIEGLHYANMTDLAWSPSGQYLFVSSRDGYVSRIDFDEGDLGIPFEKDLTTVRAENVAKIAEASRMEADGVEETPPTETINDSEEHRLSPKLEQMRLNNKTVQNSDNSGENKSPKRKVDAVAESKKTEIICKSKKSKKRIQITTISNS